MSILPSILFICTANQIRSPFAQEYFKRIVNQFETAGEWTVDSAGTWAFEGAPATPLAQLIARENDISLADHRSKIVSKFLLKQFNLILVMEHRHKEALCAEFPELCNRVYLLAEMHGSPREIPDPIAGGLESYRMTAQEIKDAIDEGLGRIVELAETPNI